MVREPLRQGDIKMLGALVTFFLIGFIALVVLGVVLAVVGTVFSIAAGVASFRPLQVGAVRLGGSRVVSLLSPRSNRLFPLQPRRVTGRGTGGPCRRPHL